MGPGAPRMGLEARTGRVHPRRLGSQRHGRGVTAHRLPHLAVEVLSTDRASDTLRKFARYAVAGLRRYWIVDPDGPEVVVYDLGETGTYVESGRYRAGEAHTFDLGVAKVTFDPADLLA